MLVNDGSIICFAGDGLLCGGESVAIGGLACFLFLFLFIVLVDLACVVVFVG